MVGIADLTEREQELRAQLARLSAMPIGDIIDDLFPDGDDDYLAMREASLLARPSVTTPAGLFDWLKTQITQPDMPEQGDFVRVMSLHKAKGLTSKVVIVAGTVEGLIPFIDDDEAPAEQAMILEEQRRLFYVALTRCTDVLVISSALSIPLRDARQMGAAVTRYGRTIASRFLGEFGPAAPRSRAGAAGPRGGAR